MLLKDFIKDGIAALSGLYPKEEARSMIMFYCADVLGFPSYQHITEPRTEVPAELLEQALDDVRRLSEAEPLQYVLGYTEFCGRTFKVDLRALIPRVETELLCMKAEEMAPKKVGLKILDLCTGSGCIAWSVALEVPGVQVVAVDLSEGALQVAKGQDFSAEIKSSGALPPVFVRADVLDAEQFFPHGSFDLILSNPPYIREQEKALMRPNVLDYEPSMALFVPDEDPLLFYRAIATWSQRHLLAEGMGLTEINEELGAQTQAVFAATGFRDVELVKDFYDKTRFVFYKR